MTAFFTVLGVLVLLLTAILLAAYICYRLTFFVPREQTKDVYRFMKGPQYTERQQEMRALLDAAVKLPFEDVTVTGADGLRLHGRWYARTPGAPVQILFHGYRSNALRDFSGGLPLALDSGFNALLVDQRAHGESEGRCLTFGVKERLDCLTWIQFVREKCGADIPIVPVGISMGAATVLMASSLDLPANVAAIIADCGYSSPEAIIKKVMRDRRLPVFPLYPLVRLGARLFGGFDPNASAAQTELRSCKVPVLFIHGEDDRFVPCEMSRVNFSACAAEKQLLTVPTAGHGLSYLVDNRLYRETVTAFLHRYI